MDAYKFNLQHVLDSGEERGDRTGTGTLSVFGMNSDYNLAHGFPAVTTKRLAWKSVVSELLWFLEGSGDERRLAEILYGDRDTPKKTIWSANADADYWKKKAKFEGDLGSVYGVQWRTWPSFKSLSHNEDGLEVGRITYTDQITNLIDGIKNDPYSRRHILTAWNPGEIDNMALPPCHLLAQFYVSKMTQDDMNHSYRKYRSTFDEGGRNRLDALYEGKIKTEHVLQELELPTSKLSCQMYQRSADMFLGVPFNIASYSLLTHMIAQVCNLDVGEFKHVIGDAHIYNNHIDQVKEQLTRKPYAYGDTQLHINKGVKSIFDFTMDDFELVGYNHHPAIKADMAV